MKKQVVFIVVITLLALISCTGCDSTVGETIDLSYDASTLTAFQWEKELSKNDTEYLSFNAFYYDEEIDDIFIIYAYDTEDHEGQQIMGAIDMSDGARIVATIGEDSYSMRITSTSEGVMTLSLKDEEENVMYFAATPLSL